MAESPAAPDPPTKDDLRKQYDAVLAEYRFQVQLNWDRAKHYLVFNTALFGAAIALEKDARTGVAKAAVGAFLSIAALNSALGAHAVAKGHEYYQEIRDLKTRLETDLRMAPYAIVSTPGMKRGHDQVAAGTPRNSIWRVTKIVNQTRLLLWVIAIFAALGSVYSFVAAFTVPSESSSAPPHLDGVAPTVGSAAPPTR
jgi:hypothetical protein